MGPGTRNLTSEDNQPMERKLPPEALAASSLEVLKEGPDSRLCGMAGPGSPARAGGGASDWRTSEVPSSSILNIKIESSERVPSTQILLCSPVGGNGHRLPRLCWYLIVHHHKLTFLETVGLKPPFYLASEEAIQEERAALAGSEAAWDGRQPVPSPRAPQAQTGPPAAWLRPSASACTDARATSKATRCPANACGLCFGHLPSAKSQPSALAAEGPVGTPGFLSHQSP